MILLARTADRSMLHQTEKWLRVTTPAALWHETRGEESTICAADDGCTALLKVVREAVQLRALCHPQFRRTLHNDRGCALKLLPLRACKNGSSCSAERSTVRESGLSTTIQAFRRDIQEIKGRANLLATNLSERMQIFRLATLSTAASAIECRIRLPWPAVCFAALPFFETPTTYGSFQKSRRSEVLVPFPQPKTTALRCPTPTLSVLHRGGTVRYRCGRVMLDELHVVTRLVRVDFTIAYMLTSVFLYDISTSSFMALATWFHACQRGPDCRSCKSSTTWGIGSREETGRGFTPLSLGRHWYRNTLGECCKNTFRLGGRQQVTGSELVISAVACSSQAIPVFRLRDARRREQVKVGSTGGLSWRKHGQCA